MRLTSIAFSKCGMLLHAVNFSSGGLLILDSFTGQYKSQFSLHPERDKIISLISVPQYNNLLVLLLETKLYLVSWALDSDFERGPQNTEFAKLGDKTSVYTCASVTKDGQYIVTADTGGSVNVYELHGGLKIVKTYKNLVSSLDTHWLKDESSHIICAGNRDTLVPMVHKWKFDPKEKPVVRRLALFDATMEPEETNIIAVATSNGTVQIIQNDDVIAETPFIEEKITSLLISNGGNNVVYATENGRVFLFDVKLNQCKEIMELSKSVKFMTILNIDGDDTIICEEGGENLQIWKSPNDTQLIEYSGLVIFCDLIRSIKRILTVAETVLKIWDEKTWKLQSKHEVRMVPKISCASLSQKQNYLSLSNANGNLNILKLLPKESIRNIKFQEFMDHKFKDGITAATFSSDEQLLALGFKTGEICIISTQSKSIIRNLEFHRREIKELHWGPADLDERILLTLANELAWWSVPIQLKKESSAQREISHSLSELMISPALKNSTKPLLGTMRTSKSLELGKGKKMDNLKSVNDYKNDAVFFADEDSKSASISSNSNPNYSSKIDLAQSLNALNDEEGNRESRIIRFWNDKKPKFPKVDGLLGVIKLDGNLARKVCVSKDFSNFLTLNGGGAICNLKILDECVSEERRLNSNGNT